MEINKEESRYFKAILYEYFNGLEVDIYKIKDFKI